MENDIHIGSIIKKKVEESKMSIAEFAEKIYCDRTTVYDLFKRSSIDIERLIRISKVLEYNFLVKVYLEREFPEYQSLLTKKTTDAENQIVYIAVPIKKEELKKIDLPDNAILLQE